MKNERKFYVQRMHASKVNKKTNNEPIAIYKSAICFNASKKKNNLGFFNA